MTEPAKIRLAPEGAKPARKSKLAAVAPETVQPKKPKVLIYGVAGVGKTYTALDFPGVFYIDTEGGADLDHYRAKLKASGGMYLGPDQGSLDFETVIGQVEALATEDHQFKTIVFDSITKLFATSIIDEQSRMAAENKKDEYGASRKPAVRHMGKLIRWVNKCDLNVIMIAHEKDLYGILNGQREAVGRTFDAYDKLEYDLHFVLRITKLGTGDSAKRNATVGKSRLLGFPEGARFDWSYAEFASRYGKDVIEKEVQKVVLATPDQVAEIAALLEDVKTPDNWQDKCFTKADVDSWAEMETGQIDKFIQFLKGKKAS